MLVSVPLHPNALQCQHRVNRECTTLSAPRDLFADDRRDMRLSFLVCLVAPFGFELSVLQLTIRTVMHAHVATPLQEDLHVNAAGVKQKKLHSVAKLVKSKDSAHVATQVKGPRSECR